MTEGWTLTGAGIALAMSFFISVAVTLGLMPWVMSTMRKAGIIGRDRNKKTKAWLPEMGGVGVILGYMAGVFTTLILLELVLGCGVPYRNVVISGMFCILGVGFIGVVDDIFDMRQRVKAFLPMFFAIPLAIYAVEAYGSKVTLLGSSGAEDIGVFMLLLIMFAVTAASNGANMLEGYNGLGAGLAIIIAAFLSLIAFVQGRYLTLVFLLPLLGASLAFLRYNYFPAKVFPGDTFTLFYGGVIAVAVIVGPLKEVGAFLFIPMIVEFFLKMTSKFKAENFAKMDEFGHLRYNGPTQSLTHWFIKHMRVNERELVWRVWGMEVAVCACASFFVLL